MADVASLRVQRKMSGRRRSKPARVAKFVSNAWLLSPVPKSVPSPSPREEPQKAPAQSAPEFGTPVSRGGPDRPLLYDIVSRGNMPAILFHNNVVEVLYRSPDACELW
jgi:hypothetical protein